MTAQNNTRNGFKTRLGGIESKIRKKNTEIAKLTIQEKRARNKWTTGYNAYMAAVDQLADLKVHKTQREARLKAKIKTWRSNSAGLTVNRDTLRGKLAVAYQELMALQTELTILRQKESSEAQNMDEIVTQVFALNATVVQASEDREKCLNRHVFPRLIGEDKKLRSRVSFTSSNGLRRVVALVNTMTIVKGDLADEAQKKIQQFFDRWSKAANINVSVRALYDLTRQLLVEKISFKVGPNLHLFISMDINRDIFPELADAQTLLRQSIQSEKTTNYIRIYERPSTSHKWENVRQS